MSPNGVPARHLLTPNDQLFTSPLPIITALYDLSETNCKELEEISWNISLVGIVVTNVFVFLYKETKSCAPSCFFFNSITSSNFLVKSSNSLVNRENCSDFNATRDSKRYSFEIPCKYYFFTLLFSLIKRKDKIEFREIQFGHLIVSLLIYKKK